MKKTLPLTVRSCEDIFETFRAACGEYPGETGAKIIEALIPLEILVKEKRPRISDLLCSAETRKDHNMMGHMLKHRSHMTPLQCKLFEQIKMRFPKIDCFGFAYLVELEQKPAIGVDEIDDSEKSAKKLVKMQIDFYS